MPDDLQLALAHYQLQFPDLASLGAGTPPKAWKTEYDRVAAIGLSATLVNQTASDGTSVGSLENFDQRILLRALHERRAQLDPTYSWDTPPKGRRLGITVSLGESTKLLQS